MQVTLDQEQWDVPHHLTIGEVLADLTEKAHARARLITTLTVDQRRLTDRDLDATFLGEQIGKFGTIHAISQSMTDVMRGAERSVRQYAAILRDDALSLAAQFRYGEERTASLDAWLGRLADYLEFIEGHPTPDAGHTALRQWVTELLEARTTRDTIRMADLLEYELAPRLER